ncbi:ion channel [Terribacillus halophilus]|jgi:voltage-gated potassium channel|uniref:ion channel n=1 Tax=Terribacillus halophilus TaxID=361279 RepID=UPI0009856B3E|nr:ion channel [Terribacillus halophilus]
MLIFIRLWKRVTSINFLSIAIASVIVVMTGTVGIHFIERENFPSWFDGFWWTMTTVTTVGYGDFYPETVPGRLIGIFLFLFGIGVIGVLIGKIADGASAFKQMQKEGKLLIKRSGHYIYIGWSRKVKKSIEEVMANEADAYIVIIDDRGEHPFEHEHIAFVQGDPTDEATLKQANLLEAARVAVFSDPTLDSTLLADAKTLLIASAVEGISKAENVNIHTVVEINNESHIPKFEHISIDDFILSNDSVSLLMAKAVLTPGTSNMFRQLLSKQHGSNIHEVKPKAEWKTYEDAQHALAKEGMNLFCINENMNFLLDKEASLEPIDRLFVIANDDVYEKFKHHIV